MSEKVGHDQPVDTWYWERVEALARGCRYGCGRHISMETASFSRAMGSVSAAHRSCSDAAVRRAMRRYEPRDDCGGYFTADDLGDWTAADYQNACNPNEGSK